MRTSKAKDSKNIHTDSNIDSDSGPNTSPLLLLRNRKTNHMAKALGKCLRAAKDKMRVSNRKVPPHTRPGAVATSNTTHPTSAAQACFNTTELLEAILGFLDFKTLLLSQRVSTQFKDVIDGSLLLQRKLFFAPATLAQIAAAGDVGNICARREATSPMESALEAILDVTAAINPAFFDENRPLYGSRDGVYRELRPIRSWAQRHATPWKLSIDNSSCFRMYMTHPMPQRVRFSINGGQIRVWIDAYDANGPRTFGKLIENAEKELKKNHLLALLKSGGVTSGHVMVPGKCFRVVFQQAIKQALFVCLLHLSKQA